MLEMNLPQELIYNQSSVLPFRFSGTDLQLLLITSLNKAKWIFPKGIIQRNLSAQESAQQEAFEEAGVRGKVVDFVIGEYRYQKWGGICQVVVFPMIVTRIFNQWPEDHRRKRIWVRKKEINNYLESSELKNIVKFFHKEQARILAFL